MYCEEGRCGRINGNGSDGREEGEVMRGIEINELTRFSRLGTPTPATLRTQTPTPTSTSSFRSMSGMTPAPTSVLKGIPTTTSTTTSTTSPTSVLSATTSIPTPTLSPFLIPAPIAIRTSTPTPAFPRIPATTSASYSHSGADQ